MSIDDITLNVGEETLEGFTENPSINEEEVQVTTDQRPSLTEETGEAFTIGTISSSSYGGFTKILSLLTSNMGKTDIISIEQGKLSIVSGGGYLYCDLSILFGENDMDIIDPQYSIKLMKLISGGDEVVFIDDVPNDKYLISNKVDGKPLITITLPKPDPSMNPRISKPELGDVGEELDNINPDLVNTITTAEKNLESQYFILEVNENPNTGKPEVISIATDQETFKYNFKDSWEADDGQELQKYKLFNPFPIAKPDSIKFELYKVNDEYWVKTSSEVGLAHIEYMEKLTPMGIFDTFNIY